MVIDLNPWFQNVIWCQVRTPSSVAATNSLINRRAVGVLHLHKADISGRN